MPRPMVDGYNLQHYVAIDSQEVFYRANLTPFLNEALDRKTLAFSGVRPQTGSESPAEFSRADVRILAHPLRRRRP